MMGERSGSNPSLLGLMGSVSAALNGEVQNGKEKRGGRALFDTRPCAGQPSVGPGGREQAASLLPPSPPWRDVAGWRSGQTSRPLASAAELGQLVSRTGAVLAPAAWRRAVHPQSAIGPRRKSLRGVGERMGWAVALGMCRAGCKAESRHVRWEVTFPLHGWCGKRYRIKGKGLLGTERKREPWTQSAASPRG